MRNKLIRWVLGIGALIPVSTLAMSDYISPSPIDYTHYHAKLEPSFQSKSVAGSVNISFVPKTAKLQTVTFSAKYKSIRSVKLDGKPQNFAIQDEQLNVNFIDPLRINKSYTLTLDYQAKPERGMKFYDDHLFTVYHTKNWMPVHNNLNDKASFELELTHHKDLTSKGNGKLVSVKTLDAQRVSSHWQQHQPAPIYTFGFALGQFETLTESINDKAISYLYRQESSSGLNKQSLQNAFKDVAHMLEFFEQKAGFALPQPAYTYAIVEGYMAQEATSYSLVGEQFVHTVLKDKNENWFIAHELAHEWWGNSITCANFSHFWLNEGLVQFLVAAYKQELFGEHAYNQEINLAMQRVTRAVDKGKNAPVAFRHQIEESQINRSMAYSKGALIFYMLRNQLGDKTFWQGLKQYSVQHQGQSVTTDDLKHAFEQVADQKLDVFFETWVYGDAIPQLSL